MNDMTTVQKDKLMGDLRVVIADAEELLRMTADQAGESAADVRSRVQAKMNQAKADLIHLQEAAVAKAKAANPPATHRGAKERRRFSAGGVEESAAPADEPLGGAVKNACNRW